MTFDSPYASQMKREKKMKQSSPDREGGCTIPQGTSSFSTIPRKKFSLVGTFSSQEDSMKFPKIRKIQMSSMTRSKVKLLSDLLKKIVRRITIERRRKDNEDLLMICVCIIWSGPRFLLFLFLQSSWVVRFRVLLVKEDDLSVEEDGWL
jgi:hypothetical protein